MRNQIAAGGAHRPARVAPKAEKKYQQGLALMQQSRWNEAAAAFEAAIERSPKDPVFWLNLAQARRKQGDAVAAERAARRAADLDPRSELAQRMLADSLANQGRAAQAAQLLSAAAESAGESPDVFLEAGLALLQAEKHQEATEMLLEALRRKPDYIPAHVGLGNAFARMGVPLLAAECFRTVVTLDPGNVVAWSALVHQSMNACHWERLDSDLRELEAARIAHPDRQPVAFTDLSLPGATAADHLRSAAAHASVQIGKPRPFTVVAPAERRPGRLRIGYLSSDFYEHATSYLLAHVLELHDRGRFEVFLYSYGPDDRSPMRRRIMAAAEHFVDLREAGALATAERIRADGIDILVDLKGYTYGSRAEVLGYRAAPIQVSFLGFPGTLGTSLVDYIVTDPIVTPPEAAGDYAEKFAYLPDCYQPNDRKRPIGPPVARVECGLPESGFVYCCFNNTYKITPAMFDLWCRLLLKIEGSVLWLLDANLQAKDRLRVEASTRGVDPQRLIFAPRLPLAQHLARLANADLVLDTLPYNAHTTASDALWAGVPVVTCPGETFASRVAASLLKAADVPELVATSLDEYAGIALRLAQDPTALAALKEKLRTRRGTCALFDSERYARNLEALYERMLERWRSGQPAGHLPPQQRGIVRADVREDTNRDNAGVEPSRVRSERKPPPPAAPPIGPNDRDLADLRTALSLRPYDRSLQAAYESAMQLRRELASPGAIGLVITCEKYFERALRLHAKLSALNALPLRLVVGRGAKVPAHADLMEVDAPDDYESLPKKVRAAFVHAFERHGCALFKIDDDLQITDAARFVDNVRALVKGDAEYAGFEVGSPDHDRTWHWNKCRDAALNRMPYGKRFRGTWANGPFYYLSATALRAFALATLRFPCEIDGELYEDKFVGDTLRAEGLRLSPLPPGAAGVSADNLPSAPTVSRAATPPARTTSPWAAQRLALACHTGRDDRPLKVAVVTPYHREDRRLIERCVDSVRTQTYGATHIVVADGFAQPWLDGAGVRHLRLDHAHSDYGNTPRAIGGLLAVSEGFDAVCFLDADNWYESEHVAACVDLALADLRLDYVIARRRFVRLDGSALPIDAGEDDRGHVDTSCLFLLRGAFHTIARWATMPRPLSAIGDRVYVATLRSDGLHAVRADRVTVNYLCTWSSMFRLAGEEPPAYAKPNVDPTSAIAWWKSARAEAGGIVDRLIGAPIAPAQLDGGILKSSGT